MRTLTVSLFVGIAAITVSGTAVAQDRTAQRADLTRASVQERAAHAFQRVDVNGDGKIDAADREAQVKARFDRTDANNDGTIDFTEFSARRALRGDRPEGARGESRGSGERMGHRRMRGGMGMRGPGRGADANSDGTVTRAEFESAFLARFDAADADSDGTVTAAERKAHRDSRRDKRREHRAPGAG